MIVWYPEAGFVRDLYLLRLVRLLLLMTLMTGTF